MSLIIACFRPDAHAEHFYHDHTGRSLVCLGRSAPAVEFAQNYAADNGTEITFEAGIDEVVHPDFAVAMRLEEVAMSDCKNGCKILADTRSRYRVLAHSRAYGCTVTREKVLEFAE